MTDRLRFDDRILNPYTVEDLAQSHPALHSALGGWFKAFSNFDDTSLARLIGARGAEDVDKWKVKGEAALKSASGLVSSLDVVIAELTTALAAGGAPEALAQLAVLLEAARTNRTALADHAPALVAKAIGSTGTYDTTKADAAAAVERTAERLEAMRARAEDPSKSYRD